VWNDGKTADHDHGYVVEFEQTAPGVPQLLVANTPPGPIPTSSSGPISRYTFSGTGALTQIPEIPASALDDPLGLAVSSTGELFVANRHRNAIDGGSTIARFRFDGTTYVPNGVISGNGLNGTQFLTFCPSGELIASNITGTLSRFVFRDDGTAVPNGTISTQFIGWPADHGSPSPGGLACSLDGELFLLTGQPEVFRYRINPPTGPASPNGSFPVPGAYALYDAKFSSCGELFVLELHSDGGTVYRYLIGSGGTPIPNGSIAVPRQLGLAFSPSGELFVGPYDSGVIARFTFDSAGNAVPNGQHPAPYYGGGLAVLGPPPEIPNLYWPNKTTLAWAACGTTYDVMCGDLTDVWYFGTGADDRCLADDLVETQLTDSSPMPPPGKGWFFLVRRNSSAGTGRWETSTDGRDRMTTVCPDRLVTCP